MQNIFSGEWQQCLLAAGNMAEVLLQSYGQDYMLLSIDQDQSIGKSVEMPEIYLKNNNSSFGSGIQLKNKKNIALGMKMERCS